MKTYLVSVKTGRSTMCYIQTEAVDKNEAYNKVKEKYPRVKKSGTILASKEDLRRACGTV